MQDLFAAIQNIIAVDGRSVTAVDMDSINLDVVNQHTCMRQGHCRYGS